MDIAEIMGRVGFDYRMAIFNTINFLVVLFILNKFLFKKIGKAISERQAEVEESIETAEKLKDDIQSAEEKSKEIIEDANKKANEIVKTKKVEAEVLYAQMKEQAQAEVEAMKAKSKAQLEKEKQQLLDEIKIEAAELIISASAKVLEKEIDEEEDKKIVKNYLKAAKF
jgi:F-type H+-transporting ATPase subunit b